MSPDNAAGSTAWIRVTAALMLGSLVAWNVPSVAFDWQPELVWQQPWRQITAAWVHWSPVHLGLNLLAAAVVGAYGWAARVTSGHAWAWLVAWPLTHLGLLFQPELAHYGGLSGVLHAGVALVCLGLLRSGPGARRLVGAGVSAGLLAKLASEQPFGPALQHWAGWDIAMAPLAHTSGALAGCLCGAALWVLGRSSGRAR